ncbi:FkbM family methyltransferase [Poriferisphaera sp. WC338]|uniref:FkbM family methyltransferase n=1 Tax=Poriferisphaera sp. WC338 TaxID=3425129 RepID=UPI003D814D11
MKIATKKVLYQMGVMPRLEIIRHAVSRSRWSRKIREERQFYKPFVKRGDLVFDVGVNRGFKSVVFRQMGARVVGVEPLEECAAELRQRFDHDPHFTLEQKALGDKEGVAEMGRAEVSAMCSLSETWQELGRTSRDDVIEVAVTTMDHLIAKHGEPDFCKLDVEGYEPEVLSGLNVPLKAMSFEFTPHVSKLAVRCIERIESLGHYEYNKSPMHAGNMCMELDRWINGNKMIDLMQQIEVEGDMTGGDIYVRRVA